MNHQNLILKGYRVLVGVFLLFGLVVDFSLAGDFWNERPYTQWSAEETLLLLSDSPWCKTFSLRLSERAAETPRTAERAPELAEATISQHSTCCRTFETMTTPVPGRSSGNNSSGAPGASTQTPGSQSGSNILSYRVLWLSSVRIRQAMTRALQLQGVEPTDAVRQAIEQPAEEFVIAVTGAWMTPFEGASLERLKENVYLRSAKTSQKTVRPNGYISPKERQDGMAVFIFPRIFGGKPAFDQSDGEVEFSFSDGSFKIRTRFKLEKMISDGKPDL